jgi:DNA-directed RNA polymerase subunit RPC12/RpoP
MSRHSCPACGASVEFRSAAPYAVCSYCRSMLLRRDVTLESIGRVAEVPDDMSPLQLGVTGIFDERRFTLIGRVRKVWEQGSWNEWCAQFADQRLGWLAEAQGELVMTFEQPRESLTPRLAPAALANVAPGATFTIDERRFVVSDVKEVECIGAEGELIAYSPVGTPMTSIDLRGPGLEFGTFEASGDDVSVFVGRFVEFTECRFSGLRRLDGWARPESGAT